MKLKGGPKSLHSSWVMAGTMRDAEKGRERFECGEEEKLELKKIKKKENK